MDTGSHAINAPRAVSMAYLAMRQAVTMRAGDKKTTTKTHRMLGPMARDAVGLVDLMTFGAMIE